MGDGKKGLTSYMTPAQLRLMPRRIFAEISKVEREYKDLSVPYK
jgi:hypothetical protein